MTQINKLNIPDKLYSQIRGMALSQACSVNEQIVVLLQQALDIEQRQQAQSRVLSEIRQARWTPPTGVVDGVAILREIRGYDE